MGKTTHRIIGKPVAVANDSVSPLFVASNAPR